MISRNNVLYGNIFLSNSVSDFLVIAVVNGDILEDRHAVRTGFYGVSLAVSCNFELSVANLIILRLLIDFDRTFLQIVVKIHIYSQIHIALCQRNILSFWSLIPRSHVDFGHSIGDWLARFHVVNLET